MAADAPERSDPSAALGLPGEDAHAASLLRRWGNSCLCMHSCLLSYSLSASPRPGPWINISKRGPPLLHPMLSPPFLLLFALSFRPIFHTYAHFPFPPSPLILCLSPPPDSLDIAAVMCDIFPSPMFCCTSDPRAQSVPLCVYELIKTIIYGSRGVGQPMGGGIRGRILMSTRGNFKCFFVDILVLHCPKSLSRK